MYSSKADISEKVITLSKNEHVWTLRLSKVLLTTGFILKQVRSAHSPVGCITELTYGRASITSNFLTKLVISQTAILCSACYLSIPT